jgi:hypothetical protein
MSLGAAAVGDAQRATGEYLQRCARLSGHARDIVGRQFPGVRGEMGSSKLRDRDRQTVYRISWGACRWADGMAFALGNAIENPFPEEIPP